MTAPTKPRVSLDEFLAMEETKPYLELMDGEVIEKPMPTPSHGTIVIEAATELNLHKRRDPRVRVETDVRHADIDNDWVYLPDISVTRKDRRLPAAEESGPVLVFPDLAIEVLSPGDRPGRALRRVSYYLRAGTTLIWLIDPEDESVTVFERGEAPRVFSAPELLTGEPVLEGFTLDLGRLFATLHD